MKVIEKTGTRESLNEWIQARSDPNGFGYSEGYSVNLELDDGETIIRVDFGGEEWQIDPKVIADIINDREELNKSIEET